MNKYLLAIPLIIITLVSLNYLQTNKSVPSLQMGLTRRRSGGGQQGEQGSYTYFAFEREWPGTVCKTKGCSSQYMGSFDGKNFNIHGLWPNGNDSDSCYYPQDCSNEPFDYNQISSSTRSQMNKYWNGLYDDTESFVTHEWQKHGTCFDGDMNTFFTTVVQLHSQYNPISALASNGIVPSDSKGYSLDQIEGALSSAFGAQVEIQCKNVDGQQSIFAVDMYIDKNLSGAINNPCGRQKNTCNGSAPVYIPTI